jgi:hypothetical protein
MQKKQEKFTIKVKFLKYTAVHVHLSALPFSGKHRIIWLDRLFIIVFVKLYNISAHESRNMSTFQHKFVTLSWMVGSDWNIILRIYFLFFYTGGQISLQIASLQIYDYKKIVRLVDFQFADLILF